MSVQYNEKFLPLFVLIYSSKVLIYNCLIFRTGNSEKSKLVGYLLGFFKIAFIIDLWVVPNGSSILDETPPHTSTPYCSKDCTYAKYASLHCSKVSTCASCVNAYINFLNRCLMYWTCGAQLNFLSIINPKYLNCSTRSIEQQGQSADIGSPQECNFRTLGPGPASILE